MQTYPTPADPTGSEANASFFTWKNLHWLYKDGRSIDIHSCIWYSTKRKMIWREKYKMWHIACRSSIVMKKSHKALNDSYMGGSVWCQKAHPVSGLWGGGDRLRGSGRYVGLLTVGNTWHTGLPTLTYLGWHSLFQTLILMQEILWQIHITAL